MRTLLFESSKFLILAESAFHIKHAQKKGSKGDSLSWDLHRRAFMSLLLLCVHSHARLCISSCSNVAGLIRIMTFLEAGLEMKTLNKI
jgi:hypothetical protein